jgi:Big-like domain-containing protein
VGGTRGRTAQEGALPWCSHLKQTYAGPIGAIVIFVLGACASPGLPPGGPERHTPPMITRIQPDTNSVAVRGKEFVLHFDEVISEHPAGATSLNDLVLISPRNGAPVVDWHRSSLSIRPNKGWKANTAYTVTILPGISDLRGNVRMTSTVVTFSTGASIPRTVLGGTLFDWLTGLPVNTGMVEARPAADTSTVYLAASDSIGHYRMIGLPVSQYLVRGYVDQNRNRAVDPGEAFDTTRVYLADTLNLEMLAFAHDSTGPRLGTVSVNDSVTIRAIFDTPLDPRVRLTPAQFALTGPDSVRTAIVSVTPAAQDSARVTTPLLPPVSQSAIPIPQKRPAASTIILPKPTRPLLVRDVLLKVAKPLRAGSEYRLDVIDAVGPTGRKLSSARSFTVPKAAAPAAADSSRKQSAPALRPPTRPVR